MIRPSFVDSKIIRSEEDKDDLQQFPMIVSSQNVAFHQDDTLDQKISPYGADQHQKYLNQTDKVNQLYINHDAVVIGGLIPHMDCPQIQQFYDNRLRQYLEKRAAIDINACNQYLNQCQDQPTINELKILIEKYNETQNIYAKKTYALSIKNILKH